MLVKLGEIIERKPWLVVILILIATIGFSLALPTLEFKTEFDEFSPDDKIGLANERIKEYFGASQRPIFALIEKENTESIVSPEALRDLYYVEKELNNYSKVDAVISITTFLNLVCMVEFGNSIENCTDEQLIIALNDMFISTQSGEIKIFTSDDPNEPIDYKRFPRFSKGESIDSADIKNCYMAKDNDSMTFSFEVYDLSDLKEVLRPSLTRINVMEWYLNFENLIKPVEDLDISYKISAHIEPSFPFWEVGGGIIGNLREIFQHFRNRKLLNSYKMETYLWISLPGQSLSFPIPLKTGNISFEDNRINVDVSIEELGQYGIATQFGTFELPAKLSNFSAGVRYYQRGLLKKPGGRVVANISFLLNRLEKVRSRPLLGSIATRILDKYGNITWEEFDNLFAMMEDFDLLPEAIGLKDIDRAWINSDVAKNSKKDETTFFIIPYLFDDLQINALAFLSGEYGQKGTAQATLIIIQFDKNDIDNYEIQNINNAIIEFLDDLDADIDTFSIEVTGELIVSAQIDEITNETNQVLGPAMFIMIVFILFVSFRKGTYVIFPLLSLLIAMIWLFGTMALIGIAFNVLAVALIPLILGLGVDYSVHFFHNYRAELDKGKTPAIAIKQSVKDIGTAIFLAWLTTAIAFMSFISSNMIPIRQFGMLLAIGITYTFITAITFLPAIRYIADRRKKPKIKEKSNSNSSKISLSQIMGKISLIVISNQKKIIAIMVLLTIIFAMGAIQLEKGFDLDQFIPADNPALLLYEKITEYFPSASNYQEFILIEGDIATVEVLKGIYQTHENIKDDTFIGRKKDGSIKVTSIYSEIKLAINNNQSLIEKFNIDETTSIPRTDDDVKLLFDYLYTQKTFDIKNIETGDLDMSDFETSQIKMVLYKNNSRYTATVIRYYIDTSFQYKGNIQKDLEVLTREIKEDMVTYGKAKAIATGGYHVQFNNTSNLTTSQFTSTGISLLFAAIVLIITYRNPILGLIAMMPVSLSTIWILGTMYYFGYILDILTVTVTSITIGIGIDYAIHATERFRLVADKTGDVDKAVFQTISHTGGALLIAALTTALAFSILVLAPIPPQQRFGIILAITICYSFLTSVLFLPLFLARWAKWRKKRKGYIISTRPAKDID